jgi:hypothetical protein
MVTAMRSIRRHCLPLLPYGQGAGYKITRGPVRLAWFSKSVGDRLIADGLVDSEGNITVAGMRHVHHWKDR